MSGESAVHEARLRSGVLRVTTHAAELPLDELCGFGSRRSRRRGFVFVSKVLGKHWPVRPRVFQDCCDRLAARLTDLEGPAVLVAMAETATGLGHGIFESWLRRTGHDDLLFLHGTRYALAQPPALTFEESHSHATRHWLYAPTEPDDRRLFDTAHTLVIVDDEMSTGSTAANLAAAYRRHNPALRQVVFVCLTDWLTADSRAAVTSRVGVATRFVSLLRGTYLFEPDPAFDPGSPPLVESNDCDKTFCLPANFGRVYAATYPIYGLGFGLGFKWYFVEQPNGQTCYFYARSLRSLAHGALVFGAQQVVFVALLVVAQLHAVQAKFFGVVKHGGRAG